MEIATLVDLLRRRAQVPGGALAYTFLEDGVRPSASFTYAELDAGAGALGAQLQALGACGERALLLYPAGLEVLAGLFGCLYAGVIVIPAPLPEATRLKRAGPRLRAVAEDARAALVLTTSTTRTL